jgi:hypothetical protein
MLEDISRCADFLSFARRISNMLPDDASLKRYASGSLC